VLSNLTLPFPNELKGKKKNIMKRYHQGRLSTFRFSKNLSSTTTTRYALSSWRPPIIIRTSSLFSTHHHLEASPPPSPPSPNNPTIKTSKRRFRQQFFQWKFKLRSELQLQYPTELARTRRAGRSDQHEEDCDEETIKKTRRQRRLRHTLDRFGAVYTLEGLEFLNNALSQVSSSSFGNCLEASNTCSAATTTPPTHHTSTEEESRSPKTDANTDQEEGGSSDILLALPILRSKKRLYISVDEDTLHNADKSSTFPSRSSSGTSSSLVEFLPLHEDIHGLVSLYFSPSGEGRGRSSRSRRVDEKEGRGGEEGRRSAGQNDNQKDNNNMASYRKKGDDDNKQQEENNNPNEVLGRRLSVVEIDEIFQKFCLAWYIAMELCKTNDNKENPNNSYHQHCMIPWIQIMLDSLFGQHSPIDKNTKEERKSTTNASSLLLFTPQQKKKKEKEGERRTEEEEEKDTEEKQFIEWMLESLSSSNSTSFTYYSADLIPPFSSVTSSFFCLSPPINLLWSVWQYVDLCSVPMERNVYPWDDNKGKEEKNEGGGKKGNTYVIAPVADLIELLLKKRMNLHHHYYPFLSRPPSLTTKEDISFLILQQQRELWRREEEEKKKKEEEISSSSDFNQKILRKYPLHISHVVRPSSSSFFLLFCFFF